MNYFNPENAAERYSKGRPHFHSQTIARIKKHLKLKTKFNQGLDVACGTGLSTIALREIVLNVFGTDTSEEMLKRALLSEKIDYSIASAENQPFPENSFDIITVCSGVHWFDIDKFLVEANRLLTKHGWLVLYDNFFISEMEGVDNFSTWYPEVYLKMFPAPKRNDAYDWSSNNLVSKKFVLDQKEEFKNSISCTKPEFILYLTTQSNITAMIERKKITYHEVEKWLNAELEPFFSTSTTRTIRFGNWIKYLRKNI